MIVDKFSMGDFISPGTWVTSAEDSEVCFNLLVNIFCLTIGLWVICGGEGGVVIEEFAKLLGEGRGKL